MNKESSKFWYLVIGGHFNISTDLYILRCHRRTLSREKCTFQYIFSADLLNLQCCSERVVLYICILEHRLASHFHTSCFFEGCRHTVFSDCICTWSGCVKATTDRVAALSVPFPTWLQNPLIYHPLEMINKLQEGRATKEKGPESLSPWPELTPLK